MLHQEITGKLQLIHDKINLLLIKINDHLSTISTLDDINRKNNLYIEKIRHCNYYVIDELKKLEGWIQENKGKDPSNDWGKALAKIRHDLINPISGMKGYAEIILERSSDQQLLNKMTEFVDIVSKILELVACIDLESVSAP